MANERNIGQQPEFFGQNYTEVAEGLRGLIILVPGTKRALRIDATVPYSILPNNGIYRVGFKSHLLEPKKTVKMERVSKLVQQAFLMKQLDLLHK